MILKFITTFGRNEKQIKLILNDIINITKGMGQTESLMQYAMLLAHNDRKGKLGMS